MDITFQIPALGSCCLDDESGLFHRDHFRSVLAQELARLDRWERPLVLVVLDLPPFNGDAWGLFGQILKSSLRRIDLPARLAAAEVAVIMPDADYPRVRRWLPELLARLEREGCCRSRDVLYGRALARPWEGRQAGDLLARAAADLGRQDLSSPDSEPLDYDQGAGTAIAAEERSLLFAGFKVLGGSQNL